MFILFGQMYTCAVVIAALRVIWGVEAYSMGLSGAALALLTHHLYEMCFALQIIQLLPLGLILIAPWGLAVMDMNPSVDVTSHLIGVGIGAVWSASHLIFRDQKEL